MSTLPGITLSFHTLISAYKRLQDELVKQVRALASKISQANPGSFILLQFEMAQVTQMGESISNLISQVNSVISNAIRNQKTQ
ncbi:MAG: hypothetical protein ACD_17C00310G0003 [uncultured bacterium]|nr:MAG: hypothetical protein ACD_17C00310G0003 [uncultured bacterium]OGN55802.1 MAG: hypothetical protein A2796_04200 [Chlamydiae bacterium RIFCSPHIGHO2_01_FULL_44_39]OGN56475.1 MAG: hypothetical protein A3C42_02265 [Chlamydiae bacterium RIFCSPHIGHO2_02_FULL_45_9]OGN60334.1 MAG: hypothetical protein A3D96_04425 [Chlamydiae bacterium RIFCSPHIGHO2_12_FULL_44_59]OGN66317.1 MAG: hypothetical protein A2978_01870 [Chlamydiae bacterium RIFCSPLOWO2_01_FULL_44_52]OGN69268.1 MAG: hypothetical protein A3